MRHLITGGSGFLGSLIARRLLSQGEDVTILDIWDDEVRPKEIQYIHCDIRDRDRVAKAMQGMDYIHHNVALVPLTKSGKKFWEVNVEGARIAAEEAKKAKVKYFVHMSSSAIFGAQTEFPITNDSPFIPVEIYGRGKLAGELAVREVCEKTQMPLIVIRPRTILGEGRLGIFRILFEWIKENRNVYVIGSGNQLFQFVHAHDLMDAYMLAIRAQRPGAYNVGTDRFGTLREGLEHLVTSANSRSRVVSLPETLSIGTLKFLDFCGLSPLAPWHYLTYHKPFHFDVSPLIDLGWKPKYSNDEMFLESYQWFLNHFKDSEINREASAHRKPVEQKILKLLKHFS